jgi:hypothetical protein
VRIIFEESGVPWVGVDPYSAWAFLGLLFQMNQDRSCVFQTKAATHGGRDGIVCISWKKKCVYIIKPFEDSPFQDFVDVEQYLG